MGIDEQAQPSKKSRVSASLRETLLKKYNHCCVSCGIKDDVAPLELVHIVPISRGGDSSEGNLTLLCPNCHRTFDRQPREHEFVNFLSGLLSRNPHFCDVKQEVLLGRETRYRVDILASRRDPSREEDLLIECKTYLARVSFHMSEVVAQLQKYKEVAGDVRTVLAVPATLQERERTALEQTNIEVWDLHFIAETFAKQIKDTTPSYYKALFLAHLVEPNRPSREQELIKSLATCAPGKRDWFVYQSLIGSILECLFTPPLGKPIPELSDRFNANRRDFIMPNYTDRGFWSFLRDKYEADYIVVDAKNYTRKVKKTEVLQLANYLKPHGAGLFGLIITRKGGDSNGCEHTLREQWLVHRKLILVLDEEDINAMLLAKSDGRNPEEILSQKVENFRLSM